MDSDMERFLSKVDIRSTNECWPWKASLFPNGYGQFRLGNSMVRAHRVAFCLRNGGLSKYNGMSNLVLHRCDNRMCCNPAHLFLGTHQDNAADRCSKGRSNSDKIAFRMVSLSAKKILAIRKFKNTTYNQKDVAEIFKIDRRMVGKIFNSDKYPCKEGYYIGF